MLRGFKKVRCPHCGYVFMAADVEDYATVAEMSVHCPKCGNIVETGGLKAMLSRLFGWISRSI